MAEEDGLRGAKALDLEGLRASFGFVLDHASPIGDVITAAPTYKRLSADFEGHEAHAGIRPEAGRSAISAAAAAIAQMELGRVDDGTTANVGVIQGGTASNVVPRHCHVEGEARSLDDELTLLAYRRVDLWLVGPAETNEADPVNSCQPFDEFCRYPAAAMSAP